MGLGRIKMRILIPFVLVVGVATACSGRSKRTAYEPGPGSGGSTGDDGTPAGQANDGGRSSAAGGSTGSGASGGRDGSGGTPGNGAQGSGADGSGARAGSAGEVATGGVTAGGRSGEGASAGTSVSTGGASSAGRGGGAGMGGRQDDEPVTSCNEQFGFLGTWEGSRLDFYFEPLESVRLEFALDEKGRAYGRMIFGEGDPPPPPVDGDTPYPPGYWDDQWRMGFVGAETWPGYPYTVVRGAGCDATLRFGIATTELWGEWCGMMEPVYTNEYGWGCTIQGGGSLSETECVAQGGGQSATYPTWKCLACGIGGRKTCSCDETSCFAETEPDMLFDFTVSESEGKRVLTGKDYFCGDCTIRLTRAE
jgi:hypothetical protein